MVGVAQWSLNKDRNNRRKLSQLITDSFPDAPAVPNLHRILSRLPIRTIWTTNYDRLFERAWDLAGKPLAVKAKPTDVPIRTRNAKTVLYKMHGTVSDPADIVIATDDYELFRRNRGAFLPILNSDLVGQTFAFIGVGFGDPNQKSLLGLIREQLPDTRPEHYAIIRRPHRENSDDDNLWGYKKSRHAHWIDDLQRYGIEAVEIDEYPEVEGIMAEIERRISRRAVLVSGSWPNNYPDKAETQKIFDLSLGLGRALSSLNLKLVSGFGLTVGGAAIAGSLEALNEKWAQLDDALLLRPFPQQIPKNMSLTEFNSLYRGDLVSAAGIVVFVGGLKGETDFVPAEGVWEEYQIARSTGRFLIPIGWTGGAAKRIFQDIQTNPPEGGQIPAMSSLDALSDGALGVEKTVSIVRELIKKAAK